MLTRKRAETPRLTAEPEKAAAPRIAAPNGIARAAVAFEAAFLTEMLRHTGLGRAPGLMGGGAGEAQFAPMLLEAVATEIARSKPLGIAALVTARLESGQAQGGSDR
ncbi:MAG: rod-binding protein [Pseudomonadota bacterium]